MRRASRIAPLLLLLLLVSCAAKVDPVVTVRTDTKREVPPAEWMVIPSKPTKNYRTNGELYQYSEKMEAVYDMMAETLRKIQAWAKEAKEQDTVKPSPEK